MGELARERAAFPSIHEVRQCFDEQPEVADLETAVREAVEGSGVSRRLRAGAPVAVTLGSRGIAGIATIARTLVNTLHTLGFEPFGVAAMGSHGGGTAEGQRALLRELGITESSLGCPIHTEMETVELGTNRFGLPIHFDRNAMRADGIVLLNRIKPHTSFTGSHESGLLKMLVVGLGKREGAAQVHKLGLPGLRTLVPEVGAFLLERVPVVLGLGLLENARERIARVVAVEPEALFEQETRLLDEARGLMGRLPFDQLDVLVVGELGKNYSGTGLDPNVIGRQRVEAMPDLSRPVINRLVVMGLSPETRGNALGVGLADLITARLAAAIDQEPMRVNSFTSNFLTRARIPLALESDRAVLVAALDTCWRARWSEARLAIIPNTLELETLWVTEPLLEDVERDPRLRLVSGPCPIPFDQRGWLDCPRLFPDCTAARRREGSGA